MFLSYHTLEAIDYVATDTMGIMAVESIPSCAGDNYKMSQPGGWLQLLLPVGITLLVVFIEKWVSRGYEKRDQKEARKQYRETVLDWITKIMPLEKEFGKSVHELSKAIKASDVLQPEPYVIPITLHDKLSDLSIEKMTEAFIKDYKDDKDARFAKMCDLMSNLDFLSKTYDGAIKNYDAYYKQAEIQCNEWNRIYTLLTERLSVNPKGYLYLSIFQKWTIEYNEHPNSVNVHMKYLEMINSTAVSSQDYETISYVNRLRLTAQQSQALRKVYANTFETIASNIDSTLDRLSNIDAYFRN